MRFIAKLAVGACVGKCKKARSGSGRGVRVDENQEFNVIRLHL